jgi:hypothetical protein
MMMSGRVVKKKARGKGLTVDSTAAN